MNQASRPPLFTLIVALLALHWGSPAHASNGPNPNACIALHLVPEESKGKKLCAPNTKGWTELQVSGEINQRYWAYVVVTDFDTDLGLTGIQFGIEYDAAPGKGVDILRWQKCSTLEFASKSWPEAGTGTLLTWDRNRECEKEDPVVVGAFLVEAKTEGQLSLVARPVDGIAAVAACTASVTDVNQSISRIQTKNLGWVAFGSSKGHDPTVPASPNR